MTIFLVNDEEMINKVGVEYQPVNKYSIAYESL